MSHRIALLTLFVVVGWSGVTPAAVATAQLDPGEAVEMAPGDGLHLGPSPQPIVGDSPAGSGAVVPLGAVGGGAPLTVPASPLGPVPLAAMAAVAGAATAGTARLRRRSAGSPSAVAARSGSASGADVEPWQDIDVPAPPEDVLFVFVVGHGNELSAFDDMKAQLGLAPSQYRDFDYRWIIQDADHPTATHHATNDQIADGLQAFVAGLTHEDRPVYLVGFSKGGAAVAKLVARWDRGPETAPHSVIGAALLDPPISDGPLGSLQSFGLLIDPIPDDGFYDPEHCGPDGCTDERDGLGDAAGVEVIVVRNPDSSMTNFGDDPDGLRVYDLEWDGGTPDTGYLPFDPLGFIRRSGEAHSAVLSSAAVAACISQETHRIKSCAWKGHLPPLPPWVTSGMWWGRGGGGGAGQPKVL